MNALADSPAAVIADNDSSTVFRAAGVLPIDPSTGKVLSGQDLSVSKALTLTAYYERLSTTTTPLKYKWEYKLSGVQSQTWAAVTGTGGTYNTANKSITFTPEVVGMYDFRVYIQDNTSTTTVSTTLSGFTAVQAVDNPAQTLPDITSTNYNQLQRCTRILVHHDRLFLYNPVTLSTDLATYPDLKDRVYISELADFGYFPQTNIISFAAEGKQPVRKIVRYRTLLLVFTPDTIQALQGTSPENYSKSMVNNQLGVLFYNSVQVIQNNVVFLSKQGVMMVQPNPYVTDNLNVIPIDLNVKSEIRSFFIDYVSETAGRPTATVNSIVYRDQYWLYSNYRCVYKYNFKLRTWTKDTFDHIPNYYGSGTTYGAIVPALCYWFNSVSIAEHHNAASMFLIQDVGQVNSVIAYADAGYSYDMKATTKYFDFSAGYNFKKLKRF